MSGKERAKARIESKLTNKTLSENGSNNGEVEIPSEELEKEEVMEVDGVNDVVNSSNGQFKVFISYDSDRTIHTT